ncbi:hypothetical protein NQ176_g10729 [Zarea fungicola]|uniref:Uncharacterized protein n=1 Tax=Zarea fungicola TaxID=93591 RepID=A0ACC1MG12_9HYPO|nr:hypothetical protein NQ176_g10729 [Lecanicillium fungicola]
MRLWVRLIAASLLCSAATGTAQNEASGNLPVIDLGYTRHRATYNQTGKYFSFNGIRYSEPPLGKYRFRPAVAPFTVNRTITDGGSLSLQCPQGTPEWSLSATAAAENVTVEQLRQQQNDNPANTEDCLLVDVSVPRAIWERRSRGKGAPVLVWIHGGGFVFGQRGTGYYSPSGLLARSQSDGEDGEDGVVYVALNYRLGLFGFLNDVDGATPNVAILDQVLAFQW